MSSEIVIRGLVSCIIAGTLAWHIYQMDEQDLDPLPPKQGKVRYGSVIPVLLLTAKGEVDDKVSGLDAGANVVTSIVPDASLSGVAQHELDIGNGNRSVDHVFSVLGDCGFEPASPSEYRRWMDSRRGILT